MSRPPSITPELLGAAQALIAPPRELSIRDAAAQLGVSKSALARALSSATQTAPRAGKPQRGVRKAKTRPPPRRVAAQAHRQAVAQPAKEPPKPAPPPAKLSDDPVHELLGVAAELRGRMAGQPAGSKEFRDLSAELRKTLADAEKLRRGRPPAPTEAERREAARPKAEVILAKIRSGVAAYAQREADTAVCCRCGAGLSPELVARRKAEAGTEAA